MSKPKGSDAAYDAFMAADSIVPPAAPAAPAPAYPEHEKLEALDGKNQTVGDFIEWLGHRGIVLARYWKHEVNCAASFYGDGPIHHPDDCGRERAGELVPALVQRDTLIADFFEIDRNKLDEEKRAMLDELCRARAERKP